MLDADGPDDFRHAHFPENNRSELIARCVEKVARRPKRAATAAQLANGVPMFLDQLTRTLEAEKADEAAESVRISGPSGGDSQDFSEMGVSASAHGKNLLKVGFTVDQVVHDYGGLCQAITDLAFERDAAFTGAGATGMSRRAKSVGRWSRCRRKRLPVNVGPTMGPFARHQR